MTDTIREHLQHLEQQKDIKILLAVESGSRAWGFPSPDSDYDVRIIYLHAKEWYLSIQDKKDTINYFHGDLLDINGWDIRKTLRLLRKSNATPFEWAQSPIVYQEEQGFRKELLALARDYFQPYHTFNHYRGIARNSYGKLTDTGEIAIKKLFYVIRPIFAMNWIREKNTVPPMDIFSLMEAVDKVTIKEKIRELIALKEQVEEGFVYEVHPEIHHYIKEQLAKAEVGLLSREREIPGIERLNNYFRNLLYYT